MAIVDTQVANRLKTMLAEWKQRGARQNTGNGEYDNGVESGMQSCADDLEGFVNEYCNEWYKEI